MIDCSEKKGGKTAFTTWASERVRSTRDYQQCTRYGAPFEQLDSSVAPEAIDPGTDASCGDDVPLPLVTGDRLLERLARVVAAARRLEHLAPNLVAVPLEDEVIGALR